MLNQFKQHPDAWTLVDKVLDKAQSPNTKFYALQILDESVNVSSYKCYSITCLESMENFARRSKNGDKIVHYRVSAAVIRRWAVSSSKLALTDETQCDSGIDS